MERNIKVLFVRPLRSTFVEKDLELLKKYFDVRVVDFAFGRRNLKGIVATASSMLKGTLWSDLTFSWFADIHAYVAVRLSKIFRKRSIVIIGGYEVANVPEIGYGAMLCPTSLRRVRFVLREADKVLAVDESLRQDAIRNIGASGTNIQTVPTGYDYTKFRPQGEKEDLVMTVAGANDWMTVRLKGIDTFVKSARFLPDVKFLVIGLGREALRRLQDIIPTNVGLIGRLSQDELVRYYQKAKVYCQLSMREGLPNALCEAMLCECVPVGTDVQGVRTAIGHIGFYVSCGDPNATAAAIRKALESDKGKAARERINSEFSVERREKELEEIISELLSETHEYSRVIP